MPREAEGQAWRGDEEEAARLQLPASFASANTERLERQLGGVEVGGACTHTHMYDVLAVSHGPCEFTGELWGKRNQRLCGGRSPALRMAPVCTTRQLATESAHTIRRITRDIIL